jgi:homocysteine S-methyltransferase
MLTPAEFARRCAPGLVLDGGMGTELERRGLDLADPLWSARTLLDAPDIVEQVHYDYFAVGAECAISASYQVTFDGFARIGLDHEATAGLLRRSVALADRARMRYLADTGRAARTADGDPALLVAASVGPFAGLLHDGSEFHGRYGRSVAELAAFHAPRIAVLAGAGPDILACETVPSLDEARAIVLALAEVPSATAWITFSAGDGEHTVYGDPVRDCAGFLDSVPQIAAVGINCTPPHLIADLVRAMRRGTSKRILVYPNSGEVWDATTRAWRGSADADSNANRFTAWTSEWRAVGASAIGGCCRTGAPEIAAIARSFRA